MLSILPSSYVVEMCTIKVFSCATWFPSAFSPICFVTELVSKPANPSKFALLFFHRTMKIPFKWINFMNWNNNTSTSVETTKETTWEREKFSPKITLKLFLVIEQERNPQEERFQLCQLMRIFIDKREENVVSHKKNDQICCLNDLKAFWRLTAWGIEPCRDLQKYWGWLYETSIIHPALIGLNVFRNLSSFLFFFFFMYIKA